MAQQPANALSWVGFRQNEMRSDITIKSLKLYWSHLLDVRIVYVCFFLMIIHDTMCLPPKWLLLPQKRRKRMWETFWTLQGIIYFSWHLQSCWVSVGSFLLRYYCTCRFCRRIVMVCDHVWACTNAAASDLWDHTHHKLLTYPPIAHSPRSKTLWSKHKISFVLTLSDDTTSWQTTNWLRSSMNLAFC